VTITISATDLRALCAQAARTAGADHNAADSLATATVAAEQAGKRAVGVAHLFDYLQAYREGRIRSGVVPEIIHPASGWVIAEAHNGLAQVAFDVALPSLLAATRQGGIAALWLRNCYTCGELGHYPRQLANLGFLASRSLSNSSPAWPGPRSPSTRPRSTAVRLRQASASSFCASTSTWLPTERLD